jgi:phosphoribosyl 1,2-cyclic phosphodiesterase
MSFKVKFWGVRGSIACPSASHVIYGGNTSCIQMVCGGRHLIFDAGTGLRNLGLELMRQDVKSATMMLTHTHWDHINGFPFFAPAFNPNWELPVLAGHLHDKNGVENVIRIQMANPMFPVPLEAMQAKISFEDFKAGEHFTLYDDILVRTTLLNHPNDATGYRVDYQGKSVCLITDTEHVPGKPDENILQLIEGSDLVIYDSTYTEEEFPAKVGWGHSTWEEGLKLCQMANVKKFAIFHHDPDHNDKFMAGLEQEARGRWDGVLVARDNMELTLA